jgi:hypothetical protein
MRPGAADSDSFFNCDHPFSPARSPLSLGCQRQLSVDARCLAASVELGHPLHTPERSTGGSTKTCLVGSWSMPSLLTRGLLAVVC